MPRVTRPAAPPPSPWDLDRCSAAQLGQRWADLQAFASWLEAQGIKVPASWHTHGWVALQAWKARAYATDTHPGRPPTGPSAWPRSCATGSPSSPTRASTPPTGCSLGRPRAGPGVRGVRQGPGGCPGLAGRQAWLLLMARSLHFLSILVSELARRWREVLAAIWLA